MHEPIAVLEIELKSEAVFGGDGAQTGTIDIDIQADEYGLPFFAARTLKGILREQAEWYVHCLQDSEKDQYCKALFRLFGQSDEMRKENVTHHGNYEALRFGDAKLSDTIYDVVKKEKLQPREALQAITTIRSMTSIDNQTGVAQDKSLRQVRVVRPGYVFYAPLFGSNGLTLIEKNLLETVVKLTRHLGMMRHRGKGEVSCEIHWLEEQKKVTTKPTASSRRQEYLTLTIDVHEPLKISQVLSSSNSSHTLHYIPGYVLRGALVHAYIQSNGLMAEELDTESIFDDRNIQFWNGTLLIDGKRSLPFPQHLFETKEESKKTKPIRNLTNSFHEQDMEEIRSESPVKVSRHSMVFDGYQLKGKNVRQSSALHIRINGKNANPQKVDMYRYESIAPKQTFQAIVKVKTDHPFVSWLRQQEQLTLWLGGARNSGYGRCSVRISSTDENPEKQTNDWNQKSRELYVLATSDWIIYNEHGQLVSALDETWLGEQLGVTLELSNQVVNTQISGGYISQWQAYQPMIRSVQAGSIYRYEVKDKDGHIDPMKAAELMERGVGIRKNEGFGRLLILTGWDYNQLAEADQFVETKDDLMKLIPRMNFNAEKEQEQMNQFHQAVLLNQLETVIREQVLEWYKSLENINTIRISQWGKLLQIVSELLQNSFNKSFNNDEWKNECHSRWQSFWADSEKRLNNKSKLGFDGVKVNDARLGKVKLKDFIMHLLDKQWLIDQNKSHELTINHAYWSMWALQLLIRQVIRDFDKQERGA